MTAKLPDRICIWDKTTHCDGEEMPRGWTISFRPEHDGQYVRADLFDALAAERDALREGEARLSLLLNERAQEWAEATAERDALRDALKQVNASLTAYRSRTKRIAYGIAVEADWAQNNAQAVLNYNSTTPDETAV